MSVSCMCASLTPVGGTMYPANQGTASLRVICIYGANWSGKCFWPHSIFIPTWIIVEQRPWCTFVLFSCFMLFSFPSVVHHKSLSVGYLVYFSSYILKWICLGSFLNLGLDYLVDRRFCLYRREVEPWGHGGGWGTDVDRGSHPRRCPTL